MLELQVKDRNSMNLLGLFLERILNRNLQKPDKYGRIQTLRASVVIRSARMAVTLHFRDGHIVLERGAADNPTTAIEGDLSSFLQLGLGRNPLVPLWRGRIRIRGNRRVLLRLIPLFKMDTA